MYNAVVGSIDMVPKIMGTHNRNEKSLERHVVSPNGKIIAFLANNGFIVLVDSHTKHWIGDLKCNGSVRAVTFTPDSNYLFASGSDGDVYRYVTKNNEMILKHTFVCMSLLNVNKPYL